jgi:hypothetical protein
MRGVLPVNLKIENVISGIDKQLKYNYDEYLLSLD